MEKLYRASCLANQTFAMVIFSDEKSARIIMARSIKGYKRSVKYLLPQLVAGISLFISS